MPLVRNAGGIFVGENSPEALGDYTTGPSHVMPTGGAARFFSPIHVGDFTKVINVAAANRKRSNASAPPRSRLPAPRASLPTLARSKSASRDHSQQP